MLENDSFTCPNCHLGHLELKLTTYVRQYEGTMICVPSTPGWKCDVCHACQFDPQAVQRIETLIRQAGPPPNQYQPTARPVRLPTTESHKESNPQASAKPRQKAK